MRSWKSGRQMILALQQPSGEHFVRSDQNLCCPFEGVRARGERQDLIGVDPYAQAAAKANVFEGSNVSLDLRTLVNPCHWRNMVCVGIYSLKPGVSVARGKKCKGSRWCFVLSPR